MRRCPRALIDAIAVAVCAALVAAGVAIVVRWGAGAGTVADVLAPA